MTVEAAAVETAEQVDLGAKLKHITTGCKLEIRQVLCTRKMTDSQRKKMADAFSADQGSVKGSREFLNRKLDFVKDLFSAASKAKAIWRAATVKYEDGVRLIRTDKITWMNEAISECQMAAIEACQVVYDRWPEVVSDARNRLADLFMESDYEFDIRNAFGITISYPAIEPDQRLKTIAPELFEAERKRIVAQFEQAAIVAEKALQEEFEKMISELLGKLEDKTEEDGKKRVIKQCKIDDLVNFATRFQEMSIGNNAELASLVNKAKELAGDVTVKGLKKGEAKQDFKTKLAEVSKALEAFTTVAPVRTFSLED